MLTLVAGLLLTGLIVAALYAFGVFSTPYLDAFRFAFYLLLVLLVLSVWFSIGNQPYDGYDATVGAAK
jgi:FtsH-binding integral membrane protein